MGNASSDKKTKNEESSGIGCEEKDHDHETERLDSEDAQTNDQLKKTVTHGKLPVCNALFVCQKLIDVPAVRAK